MIDVGWIVLDHRHDGAFVHEPGDVVDVPISVISLDAVSQPQNVADAQIVAQILLNLCLRQLWIAVGVEQAGGGGEQAAETVDVERAAFHHDAGMKHRDVERRTHERGDHVVEVIGRILVAPGIEAPVDDGLLGLSVGPSLHEDGAVVPAPRVVGGMVVEMHSAERHPFRRQEAADRRLHLGVGHVDVDLLAGREVPHHRGKDERHRLELAGPRLELVGPAEPGAAVRRPLGGHRISQGRRSRGQVGSGKWEVGSGKWEPEKETGHETRDAVGAAFHFPLPTSHFPPAIDPGTAWSCLHRHRYAGPGGRASACGSRPPCPGPPPP